MGQKEKLRNEVEKRSICLRFKSDPRGIVLDSLGTERDFESALKVIFKTDIYNFRMVLYSVANTCQRCKEIREKVFLVREPKVMRNVQVTRSDLETREVFRLLASPPPPFRHAHAHTHTLTNTSVLTRA